MRERALMSITFMAYNLLEESDFNLAFNTVPYAPLPLREIISKSLLCNILLVFIGISNSSFLFEVGGTTGFGFLSSCFFISSSIFIVSSSISLSLLMLLI